jgi:hypothetical protein
MHILTAHDTHDRFIAGLGLVVVHVLAQQHCPMNTEIARCTTPSEIGDRAHITASTLMAFSARNGRIAGWAHQPRPGCRTRLGRVGHGQVGE